MTMRSSRGPERRSVLGRFTRRAWSDRDAPGPEDRSTFYLARATELLEQWRALEEQHDRVSDPRQRNAFATSMTALRKEYQGLVRSAAVEGAPLPPPFPYLEPTSD